MTIDRFNGQYRFLSNFFPAEVVWDGISYATVEHAYQAAKTLIDYERKWIQKVVTAGEAKRLGRRVTLRADWERVKIDVMLDLLRQKFHDAQRADLLIATGDEELVEGNYWHDQFWGVCRGVGKNHLGKLLMQVRREIQ